MKRLLAVFFTAVILLPLFCQSVFVEQEIDFAKVMPADINVIGGEITCQPVRTSYGYIATGDGKQLYGFTQEGKLLWQRSAKFRLKKFLSVFSEDLVCIVSTDSKVSLLNSSGLNLWTSKCDFVISDAPIQAQDGRIFVRGKNTLSCYGIKGTRRWQIDTEEQNLKIKPALLEDGSVIIFFARTKEGKSIGHRISAYGKVLEEIVFAGQIAEALSMQEGIVLSFTDGSAGFLALEKENTVSKWTIPSGNAGMQAPVKILADKKNKEAYFIYGTDSKIARIKAKNGQILAQFNSGLGTAALTYGAITSQGIVLAGKAKACCMNKDGNTMWRVKFDPKKSIKYLFASDSGYLVLCNSNWALELYQARLNVGSKGSSYMEDKTRPLKTEEIENLMPSSYEFGQAIEQDKINEMLADFTEGNLKEKEEEYLTLLNMEIKEMAGQWNRVKATGGLRESLYFKENMDYATSLIELASESQVYFCRNEIIAMLKNVSDPSLLLILIRCCGKIAWDPDCQILNTFEYLMNTKKIQPSDKVLLDAMAESTLEICTFMGRPAFYQKGKNIIGYMLYPQFQRETREKAVNVLKKIADSKL